MILYADAIVDCVLTLAELNSGSEVSKALGVLTTPKVTERLNAVKQILADEVVILPECVAEALSVLEEFYAGTSADLQLSMKFKNPIQAGEQYDSVRQKCIDVLGNFLDACENLKLMGLSEKVFRTFICPTWAKEETLSFSDCCALGYTKMDICDSGTFSVEKYKCGYPYVLSKSGKSIHNLSALLGAYTTNILRRMSITGDA